MQKPEGLQEKERLYLVMRDRCFSGGKTETPPSKGGERIEIPRTSKTPDFTIFHRGDTPLVL